MKKIIQYIFDKIIYGYRMTSDSYSNYLKRKGVIIGDNFKIFNPKQTTIDSLNPHLLTIGNNVKITGPVTILTHDYSVCVLDHIDNKIYGKQKPVFIGDNVFIGYGATILCGSTIGNNTIIGANSVVSGNIESDSVYAGNPAKRICGINEYRKKIEKRQVEEAKIDYLAYKKRYNKKPPIELFHEYFYLFSENYDSLNKVFINKINSENLKFINKKAIFKNFDDFCEYCEKKLI